MFNTKNPPAKADPLVELALRDLAYAQDNLHRSLLAARGRNTTEQWGESGQTLSDIIAGYQNRVREAEETLARARRLTNQ